MSAQKRKQPQHSASASVTERPSKRRATLGRERWLVQLKENICRDRTARGAWLILVRAGLETATLRTLWHYAQPPADYVRQQHRHVQRINSRIKALLRAGKVEKDKRAAGEPRADLFFDRYWQKHIDVVREGMPFADDGVTVGDWVLTHAAAGKVVPDLPGLRKVVVSLGPRSPLSDRKFWLFALRCYAENAGVQLGLRRLTALANCADHGFDAGLDARTLARYLASLSPTFQAKCVRDFRNYPPPPLLPPLGS